MDTKFKKGMKVYDEIFHKGETLIVKYDPCFNEVIISDSLGNEDRYDLDGVKLIQDEYYDWNKLDAVPTLSLDPYELLGFK
jgi:hypothetical protein|nr:MAG TPA: hypothetical protein [Caudoviricetes sp.]